MYLSKNLKYLRLKKGFSQEYLADVLKYKSYTTIQKWEMGVSEPSISILKKLSQIYQIDMDTLYTSDLERLLENLEHPDYVRETEVLYNEKKKTNRVPLLGKIAAGTPTLAEQNIEDYFNIDTRIKADFALKIKGDSMINAGIHENDIVFIRKQDCLENGEIGAVLIDNEATLKKFYKEGGTIILQPQNSDYKPIILTNGNIKILGKLIAVLNLIS